ncbi:uncharacterized protein MYCFIDRAFT_171369 [Pseudocercospora fijiensis CIRAD86]|uniref:Secreted protein n=1 Tax=Pseudocercospora fijiensis (strain CIRAD86) TaxID=383855 RepID=M3B7Z1_PSEFD|nr:uncharacterized protein MYCFIDRAFT_171369 [Pseudocercospora fijiensis CIRAD86]EME85438.1 hypothetical protein MYCFIDRAFT_171369 [Pseudocercospora fijiensis CIRAD86]
MPSGMILLTHLAMSMARLRVVSAMYHIHGVEERRDYASKLCEFLIIFTPLMRSSFHCSSNTDAITTRSGQDVAEQVSSLLPLERTISWPHENQMSHGSSPCVYIQLSKIHELLIMLSS